MHLITCQSLCQCERVHGRPVVGCVLRLLRSLLVQVVHGAEGVHGVQRVAVHPVVLHAERSLPAERSAGCDFQIEEARRTLRLGALKKHVRDT